jgi:hypothetical protein
MKFKRLLRVEGLERRAMLTTFFVEAGADGDGDGSANAPYGTIQQAVNDAAALEGDDTILIAAGVYEENVEIDDDDSVTLKGRGDVIIRHPELDPEDEEAEPEDVIDAKGDGDLTLQNITVEGLNIGEDLGGRGIDIKVDGSVTLINVNVSGTDGDALRTRDFESLTVKNGNFSSLNADGMDIEDGGSVTITNTNASDNDDEGLEVDDVESIVVTGGEFNGNEDDGIDIDNSTNIRVVNVTSVGNGGNGLQVEAGGECDLEDIIEDGCHFDLDVIMSVTVIGSHFSGNDENGIQIVEGTYPADDEDGEPDGAVEAVTLIGNTSNGNTEAGYAIDVTGSVDGRGNRANGNADNTLPG